MRKTEKKGLSNAAVGLILAIVLAIASYAAFTKNVPWGGGTEYQVVFNSAQNLRVNSPVRIAGVEVGKVTGMDVSRTQATATLKLDTSPKIPADLVAEVRSVSAVGEQYVELMPRTD